MNKLLAHIALAIALVLASVACVRRDLVDPSEAVVIRINVDIKTITNVTTNVRNSIRLYDSNTSLWQPKLDQLNPEMMRVLVYDPDNDRLVTQSFISYSSRNEEGTQVFSGSLGISHGNYNFLVYNFDTPTTQVSDENNERNILAYTSEISPSQKALYSKTTDDTPDPYEGVRIHYEPEHLLVANEHNVRISPHDTLVVIETEASTVIDTYYIQIRVDGLQFASTATAVISGLSPSNHIGLNERTVDPSAAVVFDLQKGRDLEIPGENKDVLCAVFNTFGKIEDITSDLFVTFNVFDTAGNLLQYTANLDTVFKSELAIKNHWLIIEDSYIVIPNPGPGPGPDSGSGGFQPQVDDWEEQEADITI